VVESGGDGLPVTTLTGTVDQAALQSVLRRLYSVGLPLISVTCVESGQSENGESSSVPGKENLE